MAIALLTPLEQGQVKYESEYEVEEGEDEVEGDCGSRRPLEQDWAGEG